MSTLRADADITRELDAVVIHYHEITSFYNKAPSCDAYLAAYATLSSAKKIDDVAFSIVNEVANAIGDVASAIEDSAAKGPSKRARNS